MVGAVHAMLAEGGFTGILDVTPRGQAAAATAAPLTEPQPRSRSPTSGVGSPTRGVVTTPLSTTGSADT